MANSAAADSTVVGKSESCARTTPSSYRVASLSGFSEVVSVETRDLEVPQVRHHLLGPLGEGAARAR
jgi:hypothetical protein